ncbi:MAG: ABC transporter substrate-binding protein [Spirochaetaceae bacterium]|jgi:peptide/nickel transport system substrate-binding protein|nr:ABC transporter substrate-binding protein [Spirochaetaceae bacterium]
MDRRIVCLLFAIALTALGCGKSTGAGADGNVLRFGFTSEPATLDPLSPSNTADTRSILFNVFEGLVKPDTEGNCVPAVAESYSMEQGGLVYRFVIREGIVFHDGSPVRAADAVFTIEEAVKAGFSGFARIAGVEAGGERELLVTLTEPDPEFLPYLTIGIVPEGNPDREKNPVGTGPFMIKSYTAQQNLVLEKNPRYWQEGFPKLDRVTIVFLANSDALLLALRGGNIDGATITGSLSPQIDTAVFDMFPNPSNAVQLLALNNAVKPLDDIRVRRAINHAVDIPRIIEAAFYGRGEPSGSPLIPGLSLYYESGLKNPYAFDPERAKSLLAEAGYAEGFSLEITVPSNYTMHVDTAQVIVEQLSRSGINASIKLVDWGTWLSQVYQGRNYQATVISLDANNVSPRSFLSRYLSGAGGNFLNYQSEAFDRVYNAAQGEAGEARRAALYRDAQKIISGDAAAVYIQDILGFRAFPKGRFGGTRNYPLYVEDFSAVYRIN